MVLFAQAAPRPAHPSPRAAQPSKSAGQTSPRAAQPSKSAVQTSPRAASQLWRLASPSKVRRLRHGGADGEFYDDASVRQRVQLKQHPRVQAALARLWDAANTDSRDHVLDRAEYGVMHRKMLLALRPMIGPREALRSAEEDWAADAEGEAVKAIDRPKFEWALFELADLWTDSVSASEYADFCDRMLRLITTRDAAGRARWRGDEEIVRLRYRETKPTVDDNLQAALALWSGWWRFLLVFRGAASWPCWKWAARSTRSHSRRDRAPPSSGEPALPAQTWAITSPRSRVLNGSRARFRCAESRACSMSKYQSRCFLSRAEKSQVDLLRNKNERWTRVDEMRERNRAC